MLLIGAKILEYRKAAHMSQEEFARKIGVSRQAVSKWELDKAYPDLDKLVDICEVFGINIDELVSGKKLPAPENMEVCDMPKEEDADIREQMQQKFRITSMGNTRGRWGNVRLSLCAMLAGILFLFCGTVFITGVFQNAENKTYAKMARVERVYRQYTKADITFTADDSRKVLKTVWLDTDGIRDGDYVECFTDEGEQTIRVDYDAATLAVPGMLMLLFLGVAILLCMEVKRVRKENLCYVLIEDESE